MPSTDKTSLGLNQWLPNDKPTMEDLNKDNVVIDEKLSNKANKQLIQGGVIAKAGWAISGACYKTDTGLLVLDFQANSQSGAQTGTLDIADLPAGFFPASQHARPASFGTGNTYSTGVLVLSAGGNISVVTGANSAQNIFVNAVVKLA